MSDSLLYSYIDGNYSHHVAEEKFNLINPSNQSSLGTAIHANSDIVESAIESSKRAFTAWSKTTPAERGKILQRAALILRERNDELARLEVLNTGKPISEASVVDIQTGADGLEYYGGMASKIQGDYIPLGSAFAYTKREPLGVCLGIGAWNYPIQIACWKSAPALACGNTMIFKPSPLTPLTALKLAEIYKEAGLPDGVFNVVLGDRAVGEHLTTHADIAKVSLTGSVPTGKKVMRAAADSLKSVSLELGGKSPLIIFDDADLEQAVSAALLANFYTQGEICCNGTRVFVDNKIMKPFTEKLLSRIGKIKQGDPLDPKTQMGALISQDQMDKVLTYIDIGCKEGATLLCGGKRVSSGVLSEGYFFPPTVFSNCRDDMQIVQEEIFGPVMCLLPFNSEKEVITRANNTIYGLAAGVFTSNLTRAHRVVDELQAGFCWINNYNLTPIEVPFGGYKQSGIGRENGQAAIEHYTQFKSVYVELAGVDSPF